MKKRNILIILLLLASLGAAYFVGRGSVKEVKPEVITIDLTDSEKKQIEQEARLNWMPLDSAWSLISGFAERDSTDKIRWNDSTDWSFKDSTVLRVRDSTVIVYIPFYEGKDTIVKFDETVEDIRVELSLVVKPRFFPAIRSYGNAYIGNRFVTDVQMRELILTKPVEEDSFWKHRLVLTLGYGIGYYKSTTQTNNTFIYDDDDYDDRELTSTTHSTWQFNHGFQLTLGIRLW